MDTDREFYIAWLEVQMRNEELEKQWRDSRRGRKDADNRRLTEETPPERTEARGRVKPS